MTTAYRIISEFSGNFSDKIVSYSLNNQEYVAKYVPCKLVASRESQIMQKLGYNCPLITKLLRVDVQDSHTVLHMSPKAESDVFDACLSKKDIDVDHLRVCIINALRFIHWNNIIHMDIKPENILIKNKDYILCDFGLSQFVKSETMYHNSPRGSYGYIHPEYIKTGAMNKKFGKWCDLYGLLISIITCFDEGDHINTWQTLYKNKYKGVCSEYACNQIKVYLQHWNNTTTKWPKWISYLVETDKYLQLKYSHFSTVLETPKKRKLIPE